MKLRPAILLVIAMGFLLTRAAGLHFHVVDWHHGSPVASVHTENWLPHGPFADFERDHHQVHLAGAQEVESAVTPVGSVMKVIPALVIFAFIGMALRLVPFAGLLVPIRGPFRPPRLRSRAELLPPSQGPPLAA